MPVQRCCNFANFRGSQELRVLVFNRLRSKNTDETVEEESHAAPWELSVLASFLRAPRMLMSARQICKTINA